MKHGKMTLIILLLSLAVVSFAKSKNQFRPEGCFIYDEHDWKIPVSEVKENHWNAIKAAQDTADLITAAWRARACVIANSNNPIDTFEVFCRTTWAVDGIYSFDPNTMLQAEVLASGFTFLDSYYELTGDDSFEEYNESLKNKYYDWLATDYNEPLSEGFYFSEEQGKDGFPIFVLWIKYNKENDEWVARIAMECSYNRSIEPLDLNISSSVPITVDDTGNLPRYVAVWGNQRVKEADPNMANSWFTGSYNFQRDMTGKIASKKWKSSDKTYATITTSAAGAVLDGIGQLIAKSGQVKETDVSIEWIPNGDGTLSVVANKLIMVNGKTRNNEIKRFKLHKIYPHQKIAFYGKINSLSAHTLLSTTLFGISFDDTEPTGTMTKRVFQEMLRCFLPVRYNQFLEESLKKKSTKAPGEIRFGECFPEFWKSLDQKKFNNAMYKSWALETFFANMPEQYYDLLPKMQYFSADGYVILCDSPNVAKLSKSLLSHSNSKDFKAEQIWPKGFVAIRYPNGKVAYYYMSKLIEVE